MENATGHLIQTCSKEQCDVYNWHWEMYWNFYGQKSSWKL